MSPPAALSYPIALFFLLAPLSGCQTPSTAAASSDKDIRQRILGRWYREDFALGGEMPLSHPAIEFAPDGSCSYITSETAYYPSGRPVTWREAQPGRWRVAGRILTRTWSRTANMPAREQEGEVLFLNSEQLKLREFPFNHFDNYYRKIRTRNVKTNRPNQAMELTASRRTIELCMISILSPAATRDPARGSSSCSR